MTRLSTLPRVTVTVHLIILWQCKKYEAANLARKPETVYFLLRKKMKQSPGCSNGAHLTCFTNRNCDAVDEAIHWETTLGVIPDASQRRAGNQSCFA
jgi:hypothetical protein